MGCSYPGIDVGVCDRGVCIGAGCGNEIVETASNEICDDGNRFSLDGCSADCRSAERCGDGVIDGAVNEDCDCGDGTNSIRGCAGPNAQTPGATCRIDCTIARCGDDVLEAHEQCDDNNNIAGDGCRADCGGRWTAIPPNTFVSMRAVWAASATDAWAVGGGRIMRYDGAWYAQQPPPVPVTQYFDVWGSGPDDVFVVADLPTFFSSVWRYSNGTWSNVTPPDTQAGVRWRAISGSSANNVWVVGYDGGTGRFATWNGTSFTATAFNPTLSTLTDVWVSPNGDVYATDGNTSGAFLRTGGAWSTLSSYPAKFVTGTSATDVTLFGSGRGWHFDGSTWTMLQGSDEPGINVNGISATGGETIAVGAGGAILICDGTTCQISASGTAADLYGVWSTSAGHALVVGERTVLY